MAYRKSARVLVGIALLGTFLCTSLGRMTPVRSVREHRFGPRPQATGDASRSLEVSPEFASERVSVVLRFSKGLSADDLGTLESMHATLLQPMGSDGAIYLVDRSLGQALRELPFVAVVRELDPEEKIAWGAKELLDENPAAKATLTVVFHQDVDAPTAEHLLGSQGMESVEVGFQEGHWMIARGDREQTNRLVKDSRVYQVWPDRPSVRADNYTAGALSRVDEIRIVGDLRYGLTGAGVTLAEWDAGQVLGTHQELNGRVQNMDVALPTDYHATHVAGTMIARGVHWEAIGMSPAAQLLAFDNNFHMTEWRRHAGSYAAGNNSYSYRTGWDSGNSGWIWMGGSSAVDVRFGKYTASCRDADLATQDDDNLQVCSAGNERIDTGPRWGEAHDHYFSGHGPFYDGHRPDNWDSGYDTLPDFKSAKNLLIVGAVDGKGGMTSFSSWGPTDDRRIKPDLVADGDWLYSSSNAYNHAYFRSSGTSMSSPVVTGICGLVTEMLRREGHVPDGSQPAASLLRAILIHTAQDLGTVGPDVVFGWGLVDAHAAVDLIRKDSLAGRWIYLKRDTLAPGSDVRFFSIQHPADTPFRATLVWADPAGNANVGPDDDPTPAIVHDLEMAVLTPDGQLLYPWKLNPADPRGPAITGQNSVDTVERIDLGGSATKEGEYQIIVFSQGTLLRAQPFSLIVE